MAIGFPIVLLLLFGYAITFDIRHVPLGIIDQDHSTLSRDFIGRVRASEYFDLRFLSDDYSRTDRLLDSGRTRIIIVIPKDFSKDAEQTAGASLQLLVDGSNNNTALVALGYVSRLIQAYAADILTERRNAQGGSSLARFPAVIEPRIRVWFNPELKSTNFIIPGLITVVMMVMTALLTSLTIAREWENGTMEQLMAGPLRPHEIVIGKLLPYFLLGLAQAVLVVLAGTLIFNVPLKGNILCLFVVTCVFLLCGLGIGLFLSITAKSQQLAYMFAVLTTLLPSFLLSGFIFPISSMPKAVQAVTYLVPARYFLYTLRGIFLKNYGFGLLWPEILALGAFGLMILMVCIKRMKMRLD
jgi:ABC-2 type transport system permease protein